MRRASRAEAAGSRVTPADVVCFYSATHAESSAGRRDIVDGTSFHVASSPCHSDLIHQTITDPSQENIAVQHWGWVAGRLANCGKDQRRFR